MAVVIPYVRLNEPNPTSTSKTEARTEKESFRISVRAVYRIPQQAQKHMLCSFGSD